MLRSVDQADSIAEDREDLSPDSIEDTGERHTPPESATARRRQRRDDRRLSVQPDQGMPTREEPLVFRTVYLLLSMDEALRIRAHKERTSKNQVIRKLLASVLDEIEKHGVPEDIVEEVKDDMSQVKDYKVLRTLYISTSADDKLRELAARDRKSKNKLIREALSYALRREEQARVTEIGQGMTGRQAA